MVDMGEKTAKQNKEADGDGIMSKCGAWWSSVYLVVGLVIVSREAKIHGDSGNNSFRCVGRDSKLE